MEGRGVREVGGDGREGEIERRKKDGRKDKRELGRIKEIREGPTHTHTHP